MDWIYEEKPLIDIPDDCQAFVYLITNLVTDEKYVGKKNFWFKKKKQVKGKKKSIKAESDWREYWSSSDEIHTDIQKYGQSKFKREILHLCKNKAWATYYETYEIMVRNALLDPKYKNGWVMARIRRRHLKGN